MNRRWNIKYSIAAALAAIAIIAISLLANSTTPFIQPAKGANFAVLLTDPPTVPAGTTQLNMTYNSLKLHVTYPNGSSEWLPLSASGTVNLFTLINVTQTIAATTLPVNSTLGMVQFSIVNATAKVNNVDYNVTVLSNTFVVKVANGAVNQTLSGVLIDFNPTLVQIKAFDANSTAVYYYVLVPSANAVIVNNIDEEHIRVGTLVKIGENNRVSIEKVRENFTRNVTIVQATLTVKGNNTALSVTLANQGSVSFRIFGLSLHGEFNITQNAGRFLREDEDDDHDERIHFNTVPFKVNGTSLVPILGVSYEHDDDEHGFSYATTLPGESITLTFNGVISLGFGSEHHRGPLSIVTPVVDGNYTLRLMGEGFQTFIVKAAAQP